MITYGKQYIDKSDTNAVLQALKGNFITQGPKVNEFEKLISLVFGSKYSCAVSNGTAGLHLAGLALGWKKNDIILCSPISFLAASNAAIYCGATPSFVDIDKSNFNIDINKLKTKIISLKKKRKKIKSIVATDFAGNPCRWQELKQISKKYNITLINDNCHALGAKYRNKKSYASSFADVVVHSYHAVKNITTAEGGAVLTNNKRIYEKVKLLRSHGVIKKNNIKEPWNYNMQLLGYNYRISDIQCSLGTSQLKKLKLFVKKRNEIANIYKKNFHDRNYFRTQEIHKNDLHGYHIFPLLINFKKIKKEKWKLFRFLMKHNIKLQVHYNPIHLQPYYKKKYGFKKGDFPVAEKFFDSEVSLPMYYDLSLKNVRRICQLINSFVLG